MRCIGPKGYRNQSWKDAGDAVVHADDRQADLPLATVELQGHLFAAHLAMAEKPRQDLGNTGVQYPLQNLVRTRKIA